jgi:hypothetical protein
MLDRSASRSTSQTSSEDSPTIAEVTTLTAATTRRWKARSRQLSTATFLEFVTGRPFFRAHHAGWVHRAD